MASSRQISWRSLVEKADPDWRKEYLSPVAYNFSNGRQFRQKVNPYE